MGIFSDHTGPAAAVLKSANTKQRAPALISQGLTDGVLEISEISIVKRFALTFGQLHSCLWVPRYKLAPYNVALISLNKAYVIRTLIRSIRLHLFGYLWIFKKVLSFCCYGLELSLAFR